jgi:hypothetical protein
LEGLEGLEAFLFGAEVLLSAQLIAAFAKHGPFPV